MARDWEEFFDEDECCLECGEPDFAQSKTPGLCQECHNEYVHLPEAGTYPTTGFQIL